MCERDRVAGNESKKFYGQPLPMHTQTHYGWTRVKASGPRLTALVSCPLASDSLAVAKCPPPPTSPHPTYPTESACASGAGVETPTERPRKCGERADATARAWLTHKLCPPPLPLTQDPSVRSFQGQAHMHTSHPCSSFSKRACSSGAGVAAPQSLCPPACVERAVRVPRRVRGSVMTPWTPL